jgi:hypothetical protein
MSLLLWRNKKKKYPVGNLHGFYEEKPATIGNCAFGIFRSRFD